MPPAAPDFTKYPASQRAAYFGAIASLLTADREASPAEAEFLSHLAQATGLTKQDAQHVVDAARDPNNGSLTQDLTTLKESELRFALVQDLISFAQSDGQYSDAEQERIAQMAAFLGVSEEQFDALHQYQQAAADGENVTDPRFLQQSGIGSLFSQLGLPKGGGMLSGILATVGPMILQRVLSSRGGPGGLGAAPGPPGSGGGLMDILGQVMGSLGGAPPQSPGTASSMGGLGQILQVLGQWGGPGAGSPQQTPAAAPSRGGYEPVGGLIGELFPKQ
jgi:uncharacterized tellurite resistance protein B-like protein